MQFSKKIHKVIVVVSLFALSLLHFPAVMAAGSLSTLSDTMSNISDSTPSTTFSNHTIKFTTPSGVAAGQNMSFTFPTGFGLTTVVFGDVDISWGATGAENNDTAAQAMATSCSGATWGAVVASQVLTITSCTSSIPAGNTVILEIGTNATYGGTGPHQISNHATASTYTIAIAGTFGDTGALAIVLVTDAQVAVSASIAPTISFVISTNTVALGALTTGAIANPAGITLTIGTNAASGYVVTIASEGNGTVAGLYSLAAASNIASATATLTAGTAGYGVSAAITAGGAEPTIASPYAGLPANGVGALLHAGQTLVSAAAPTSVNHVITVNTKAAISGSTRAGNYVDTHTYLATATY